MPLPRLRSLLDAAATRPVVVVTGPAGYGKSTALAQWWGEWRSAGRRSSWVTAAPRHAEPDRFWSAVLAAVGTDAVPPPRGAVADPVGLLVDHLARAPQVLVVDDYDEVDRTVGADVARLVEVLPAGAHLVLAGRAAPALPLHRWRIEGRLAELCGGDLELRPDELRAVAERLGLPVGPGELDDLQRRADGWVGGLRLAALQRARGPAAAAVRGDRFAREYLAREVLDRQPPHVREFLLPTSVLDRLTPAACAAVTGRDDARAALEEVERRNAFIIPVDDEHGAYRYHRQFRALLRARLADRPQQERAAHSAAARWCAADGEPAAAVDHALAGDDAELAGRLVDEVGAALLRRGDVDPVDGWLARLPAASWAARPALVLRRAVAAAQRAEVAAAAEALAEAERSLGLPDDDELAGCPDDVRADVLAVRAFLATARGEAGRAVDLARRALGSLGSTDPAARPGVLVTLGRAQAAAGDLAGAARTLTEAGAASRAAGAVSVLAAASGGLGRVQTATGRLHDAAATYRRALDECGEASGGGSGVRATLHAGLADVLYEWDRLDDAESHLHDAAALGRRTGPAGTELLATATLAVVREAQGDPDGADAALDRARDVAARRGLPPRAAALLDAHRLRLLISRGDQPGVARWRRAAGADEQRLDAVARARLHVALEEPDVALDLLAGSIARGRARGAVATVVAALAVQSVALLRTGQDDAAGAALSAALLEVAAEGHVRTFLDEGPALVGLLRRLRADRGPAAGHAGRLLGARAAGAPRGTADGVLTARELEIVQLLDEGLSNRDIGKRLFLSAGTVKTHLYKSYAKLGVRSRLEAVATARALDLLPPTRR